jgi:hypothetical protein
MREWCYTAILWEGNSPVASKPAVPRFESSGAQFDEKPSAADEGDDEEQDI